MRSMAFVPGVAARWHYLRCQKAFHRSPVQVLWRLTQWRCHCLAGIGATVHLPRWDVRIYLPPWWPADLPVIRRAVGGLDKADLEALAAVPARSNGPFRVLSAGRLLGWKGFHLALEAFARLRRDRPDSEYWIIGDGPERRWLLEQARDLGCADAVRLLGWLPRPEMLRRLAEVDVLVHPSLHEQFGYVVLEAMAAGRLVVCLDVGGPVVLVQDGCGFRIPVRNPEQVVRSLYRALWRYAGDREGCRLAGEVARTTAARDWSWNATGARLLELYEGVAGCRETTFAPAGLGHTGWRYRPARRSE